MHLALNQADLRPQDIDYAHATSTPVGDAAEIAVRTPTSRFRQKNQPWHTLGAAGAIEAIFSIMALRKDVIPPTLNLHLPDEAAASLKIVGPTAVSKDMTYALSNAFGFGGVNASTVFKKWPAS